MRTHGDVRPLTIRLAPKGPLHNRYIILDDQTVWEIGQSFNAIARTSPTGVTKCRDDVASDALAYYSELWTSLPDADFEEETR